MKSNDLITGSLCALGCETLYGLSYIFTRQATRTVSGLALLGWRFLLAFIVMSILAGTGLIKIDLKGKDIRSLVRVALFCPVIYFIGETVGISHATASESGVFLACIPVASLAASSLILKKKPSGQQMTGILITLAGVLLTVYAAGASSGFSVMGYVFLFAAVLSYALYSVFAYKAGDYSGTEITYAMLTAGAGVFVTLAVAEALIRGDVSRLAMLPFSDTGFLTAVLYQGIGCSILAFFLSNVAIARIGVNRTVSFIGVSTVVAVAAGTVLLHEHLQVQQLFGAAVILLGVYTANMNIKER